MPGGRSESLALPSQGSNHGPLAIATCQQRTTIHASEFRSIEEDRDSAFSPGLCPYRLKCLELLFLVGVLFPES